MQRAPVFVSARISTRRPCVLSDPYLNNTIARVRIFTIFVMLKIYLKNYTI